MFLKYFDVFLGSNMPNLFYWLAKSLLNLIYYPFRSVYLLIQNPRLLCRVATSTLYGVQIFLVKVFGVVSRNLLSTRYRSLPEREGWEGVGFWGRGVATKHLVKVQPQPFRCGSETPPGDSVYVQGQGRRRFLDAACSVARILMGFLFVGGGEGGGSWKGQGCAMRWLFAAKKGCCGKICVNFAQPPLPTTPFHAPQLALAVA